MSRDIIRNDEGAAAVETAFALPILILMIWMFIQLAEIFRANAGIQQALGEGARYATLCLTPTTSGCTTPTGGNAITIAYGQGQTIPADGSVTSKIAKSVYGIGPGTFTVPALTKQNDGTSSYYDLKVTYSQPTSLLFLPGPTINVSRSKRVWVAGS